MAKAALQTSQRQRDRQIKQQGVEAIYQNGRSRLVKMAQQELAKGRPELLWNLDVIGVLSIGRLWRPLRRTIQRCLVTQRYATLNRLLMNFRAMTLRVTNLNCIDKKKIELLWKLFRVARADVPAILSGQRTKKNHTLTQARREFVAFYRELRQVRYGKRLHRHQRNTSRS